MTTPPRRVRPECTEKLHELCRGSYEIRFDWQAPAAPPALSGRCDCTCHRGGARKKAER